MICSEIWLYHNIDLERRKPIIFLDNWLVPLCRTLSSLHPRMLWTKLDKIAQWFWRRRFLYLAKLILLFCNYLPLEKGVAIHFNKHESLSPKEACAKFGCIFTGQRWQIYSATLFFVKKSSGMDQLPLTSENWPRRFWEFR